MARLLALTVSSLLLCGCTYSVHPLLEKDDYTESLDLSGTWEMERTFEGKKERHQLTMEPFSSDDKSSYDLVINGEDYVANVGKIGDDAFLQMTMLDHPIDSPPVLDSIPVYWFARIEKDGNSIRIYPTNDEWCEENLEKLKAAYVKHPSSGQLGRPFFAFTMQTAVLQKFVATHRDKLFSRSPMTWRLVKQTSKAADTAAEEPNEAYANINGIRMFYRCYGSGPPLCYFTASSQMATDIGSLPSHLCRNTTGSSSPTSEATDGQITHRRNSDLNNRPTTYWHS